MTYMTILVWPVPGVRRENCHIDPTGGASVPFAGFAHFTGRIHTLLPAGCDHTRTWVLLLYIVTFLGYIVVEFYLYIYWRRILSNLQYHSGGVVLYKQLYNKYKEGGLFEQNTPVDSPTLFAATIPYYYIWLKKSISAPRTYYSTVNWHSTNLLTLPSTTMKYHL